MLAAIVLDVLLVVILLTMIPLGFLRGGLREVCTSAGLLLGILIASNWSGRWGSAMSGQAAVSEGVARFLVAIALVVVSTALVGYGGSAAFAYRPGPGGRMYGAFLALLNGIVFVGFLINVVVAHVYDGQLPNAVQEGYVSRALSVGFEWVLLVGAVAVLIATVFGMFVRERSDEGAIYPPAAYGSAVPENRQLTQRTTAIPLDPPIPEVGNADADPRPSRPVRIREVRHWEDQPEEPKPQRDYGGGWRQTWPEPKGKGSAHPWEQTPPTQAPTTRVSGSPGKGDQKPPTRREVLRDWMKDESSRDDS